jgi:hypothetical protein
MNRDDVIRMAREAGFVVDDADFVFPRPGRVGIQLELKRLANSAYAAGAAAKRAACNAAELRRLHAPNVELLEALKLIASAENSALDLAYCKGIARAAIARAEGKV